LIKDVIDAVDQKIEGESHPNQDRDDGWGEEITGKPHAHHGCANRVHPEHGSGDFDQPFQHLTSLSPTSPQPPTIPQVD
jgi:hypothetical protein